MGPYAKDGACAGAIKTWLLDCRRTVMTLGALALIDDDMLSRLTGRSLIN